MRRHLLGALALAISGSAVAERVVLTPDLVEAYSKSVSASAEAHYGGSMDRSTERHIYSNASSVFNQHTTYDRYSDSTYADDELGHFITHNRSYFNHERGHGSHNSRYGHRLGHHRVCWICAKLVRLFFYGTSIRATLFSPSYTYYQGRRYNVDRGRVLYGGRYERITFDYNRRRWCLGNSNRFLEWG